MIFNKFSPRSEYLHTIVPISNKLNNSTNPVYIYKYILNLAKTQKKRVYGMITSKHLGFYLSQQLKLEGINVIFYHGTDEKSEEFKHLNGESEYMSHINVKK